MKHHDTRGEMKRRHNKEKPVNKRKTRCGPDCGAMPIVKQHPEAGVWHICRKCKRKVWIMPNGYTTLEKKTGIRHKPTPEQAKKYADKERKRKADKLDRDIAALL